MMSLFRSIWKPCKLEFADTASNRTESSLPTNTKQDNPSNKTHSTLDIHTVVLEDEGVPCAYSNNKHKQNGHVCSQKSKRGSWYRTTCASRCSAMFIGEDLVMEELLHGIGSQFEECPAVFSINTGDLFAMNDSLHKE
ncbi:uncharacterized protein LY89DRAFT_134609 [Mollisia scopiformis]|uniref:Uncharacterized protein n=1 Tax=Mollisia scopiformis TaxID=149040 RepID=A0A194X2A8_MOLSC|nr:uncharacterized protein LY89DRAFT_134609 [Mollisia scopiformis]KUJ14308.1 hypothetical protein LY89DRAFT_134609 [Mollisia scopiformis]